MRHYFHVLLGSVALLAGVYLLIQPVGAAEVQSVMDPYVATPENIARARAMTQEYYAQPVPPAALRTSPQQSHIRPSAWPVIKHDNPQSLGNGYVMQLVYPKPGVVCAITRDEQTATIVNSDCGARKSGE